MAPTYTMSAHLYKQFCTSWQQTRHPRSPDAAALSTSSLPRSRSSSPEKRSMDSDRSDLSASASLPRSRSGSR
ncbi:hypothetical protein HJFPF1_01871 [Paramyrothecium foliicola]|nr:hypothetical protein HJFPF1_01871 [Paramyrothecium foliicola]